MHNQTKSIVSAWDLYQPTKSLALVVACLLLWFLPFSHNLCLHLDVQTFSWLNHSLIYSRFAQLFWGYLNHPHETWLNIVFMLLVNILGVLSLPKAKRPQAAAMVLYCWVLFQLVLFATHIIFTNWLNIQRNSPSIALTPWIILSEALNIGNIKVYSHSSFPAGHVLVLVFWWRFIKLYCDRKILMLASVSAIILTLPRLYSGAHWLSDIIFTIFYANLWFELAYALPLYNYTLNKFTKIFTGGR